MGKILKPDYSMNSKLLKFWRQVHAEIMHEWKKQIFRTWIMKDWEQEGQAHTLFLENYYNPEEYVKNFIREFEEEADKI